MPTTLPGTPARSGPRSGTTMLVRNTAPPATEARPDHRIRVGRGTAATAARPTSGRPRREQPVVPGTRHQPGQPNRLRAGDLPAVVGEPVVAAPLVVRGVRVDAVGDLDDQTGREQLADRAVERPGPQP